MRLLALTVIVFATVASAGVRGSGIKLTEARKVAEFTEIEVGEDVHLEVTRGPTALTISGDDNVVPMYRTEVVGKRLAIHRAPGSESMRKKLDLVVKVSTPSLTRLDAGGGVEVVLNGLTERAFEAVLSGGVDFSAANLKVEALKLEASGGVHARLSGSARDVALTGSGGVEVRAKELTMNTVTVDASGGCDLELTVREAISGEISGGVGVKVHGNPPRSRVQSSGGASVEYVD